MYESADGELLLLQFVFHIMQIVPIVVSQKIDTAYNKDINENIV